MNHLPECWLSEGKFDAVCMCDRLRACEQRVEEAMDRAWTQTVQLAEAHARVSAHRAALDAARAAVEGCRTDLRGYLCKTDALAAIDAQRESGWCVLSLAAIDALKEKP